MEEKKKKIITFRPSEEEKIIMFVLYEIACPNFEDKLSNLVLGPLEVCSVIYFTNPELVEVRVRNLARIYIRLYYKT